MRKVMTPLISLHVVHYSCPNCGEETEEAKMCGGCNAPMRVIRAVELYGDDANEYLLNLKAEEERNAKKEKVGGVQFDSSVAGSEIESLEEEDEALLEEETDDIELGEIFPEDDEEGGSSRKFVGDVGDDFESALGILDQEDEDMPDDIEDLPEL